MKITLASNQQAHYPIVIHPDASSRVAEAANDLREKLNQITGASFTVATSTDEAGITFGIEERANPFENGVYRLKTDENGLHIIGASDLGIQHGVWGFLKDIGYRQYFLEQLWEHVPDIQTLEVEFDKLETPAFYTRRGPKPPAWTDTALWARYNKRNRLGRDRHMRTNHEYNRIVERNRAIFDANPHFISHLSTNAKFRLSAVGEWDGKTITVMDVVVADAIRQIEENPHYTSVPLGPSDGSGGWIQKREDDPEEWDWRPGEHGYTDPNGDPYPDWGGSTTDRVVFLANEVAKALEQEFPEKIIYVTYNAYSSYKPAPNITVHPNTYIETVGGFSRLGPSWRAKGAKFMGVYDRTVLIQYSEATIPATGGGMRYVENTLPFYYHNSAKTFRTDCEDSWAIHGLKYYAMSRKLWDIEEDVPAIEDDFLVNMFSNVAEIMREYFSIINRKEEYPPRSRVDYIARAYRILQHAYDEADDTKVKERIDYLTLYWRYIELHFIHRNSSEDAQTTVEATARHLYRMVQRQISIVTKWYRHYLERSKNPGDPTYEWRPIDRQTVGMELSNEWPWEDNRPFSEGEINQMRLDGIENYEPVEYDFDILEYSNDLRPVKGHLPIPDARWGRLPSHAGSTQSANIWIEPGEKYRVLVSNSSLRTQRDVPLALESPKDQIGEPLDVKIIEPDVGWREMVFESIHSGLHTLSWGPGTARTPVFWPDIKISGATIPEANGYYTRIDTREWRNAAGYTIYRSKSNANWTFRDPDGNQLDEGNTRGKPRPIETGDWSEVLKDATIEGTDAYKGGFEFNQIDPVSTHRPPDFEYYFYVPKGTEIVGGISPRHSHTTIRYPDWSVVEGWRNEETKTGLFQIPVPEGMDGQWWYITSTRGGKFALLSVPPQVCRHPSEALLPREVIEADAGIDLPDEDDDYDGPIPPEDPEEPADPEEPTDPEEPGEPDPEEPADPEPEPPDEEEPEEPPVEEPEDPQPKPIFKGFEAPRTESGYMGVYVDGVHKSNHLHESTAIPIALSHKITNPGSAVKIKQELVITINLK